MLCLLVLSKSVHRARGVCGGDAGCCGEMLGVALLHLVQSPVLAGLSRAGAAQSERV